MSGNNILVVEDDGSAAKKIMDVLESEGYAVFSASTKAVAVELASKTRPSLVFINAILADASGLEITRAIREIDELKDVPFIMLTEMKEEFNERYRSTYGIVGLLKKPVDSNELISKTVSVFPLGGEGVVSEGEEVSQSPESIEEPADEVWETGELEEKDVDELAFKSFEEDEGLNDNDKLLKEPEPGKAEKVDRIRIKVKVKDDKEIERHIEEEGAKEDVHPNDEGIVEKTAYEAPQSEENIFAGVEDEQVGGLSDEQESHPLDNEFVERTAYEAPQSQEDVFAATEKTADSAKEEQMTEEEGLKEQEMDLDIQGGPVEEPAISGDVFDETIKEAPSAPGEFPEERKEDLEDAKAKGRKIEDMDFNIGGIDAGSDAGLVMESTPVVTPGKSRNIKIIIFGVVGIVLVAVVTWLGLSFLGGGKRSVKSIRPVTTTKVQETRKEPVKDVDKQVSGDAKGVQESVPSDSVQAPTDKPVEDKQGEKKADAIKDEIVTAKKEVKKPVATTKQKPPTTVKKKPVTTVQAKYSVQVGFFKDVSNANNLFNTMKRKGYDASVKKDRYKNSTIYRVLIGKYSSRDAAYRMMRKIKKVEKMDAALHKL